MNTIPSIFNERQLNSTVLGGTERPGKILMPVTCVIVCRSATHYRERVLENVLDCGFECVVCVEQNANSAAIESLSHRYPCVHFVSSAEPLTTGDMINLGMSEAVSPHVLVVPDDVCIEHFTFLPSVAKKLISMHLFCVVPRLTSSKMEIMPVHFMPDASHSVFEVSSTLLSSEGNATLYPFDFIGFYDREKYISLGGADYTISSPYWQNLDLSMRAWLWGEQVKITQSLTLCYSGDIPEEDRTVDLSYLRFYLKNLLPVFSSDHARIPRSSFFAFNSRSQCGFSESLRQFRNARAWCERNQYRFRKDAAGLIENWSDRR